MTEDMPRARSRSPSKSPAPFSTSASTPELQRKSSTSSLHSLHRQTSSSDLHRPPSAADLKPNAHPYPIATTATALLSRANSLSSPSPNQTRHHYVPSSPSASGEFRDGRDGDREKGADKMDKETREKSERRRAEYRGHRYSRSLSSSEDMYLPSASPSASAKGKDKTASGEYSGAPSGPRALPVPPGVSANSIAARSAAAAGSYSSYAASGISPKRWTPAQLAAHLARTVSAEAGAWAAQKNVGGRAFIRMGMDGMGEGEGELGGAPPALRPAARALRQEVLQNQLASSPISSSDDEGGSGNFSFGGRNASPTRMGSVSPSRPRVSDVEEETEEPGEGEDEGTPSHRRRTMSVPVASPFTSTSTSTSTSSSPFAPRSSPFATRSNYANDGRESRSAESPSPTGGRFRNGRVRGMVRTFESSGSESGGEGSPERERERGGSGSGFRANGNGSGFRAANGSGFRANGNGNGSGFRNAGGASEEGDEDAIGGTVKPRALPVRPDGLGSLGQGDADVDLGATVRAWDHAYPNGKANAGYGNGTFVPAANGTPFGHAANASGDEEELTVEELIAREDAMLGGGGPQVQPSHTGGGGAWRTGRRGAGLEAQLTGGRLESGEYLTQQRTGGSSDSLMQQRTGGGGGRPLPAHPPSSSSSSHPAHGMNRSGSGGVHAWEAEDGAVGATVKRVVASPAPSVSQAQGVKRVFGGAEADVNDDLARNRPTEAEARREQAKAEADAQERGRARGAAVRAQLAEAADLRALVDKFRVRLEEVERRVGEMEVAAATTSSAPMTGTQKEQETPAPTQLTVSQRLDPRRLLALFTPAPAAAQRTNGANANAKREEWVGPTTLGALPSYVLLVGLGMCAVVLRVLVKRGLGAVRGRGAA